MLRQTKYLKGYNPFFGLILTVQNKLFFLAYSHLFLHTAFYWYVFKGSCLRNGLTCCVGTMYVEILMMFIFSDSFHITINVAI